MKHKIIEECEELNKRILDRQFKVLAVTAFIANLVGFLVNGAIFGFTVPTIGCGICVVIMLICGIVGSRDKFRMGAVTVILITTCLIEFPSLYYFYGATISVYFVLAIVGIILFIPKPWVYIMFAATLTADICAILAHTFFPAYVETVNDDSYMLTMLSSALIVAASVFCLIYILLARYEKQRIRIIEMGKELEEAANHDTLTGLYNRRYLMSTLGNWIKETDRKFLVTIVDIDDFKEINDKYGHLYGDEVLSEFAQVAKNEMKGNGIVARFGGEEFMFCFNGTDYVKAMGILDNIKKQLGEYSQNSRQIVITFSGGMVEYKAPEQIDNLFNDADDKLYQAKNSGKNRIIF